MAFSRDEFAARLRGLRAEKQMSQGDLALAAGVSTDAVSHYERGDYAPNVDKLTAMCQALGCSPNYIVGWSADRSN